MPVKIAKLFKDSDFIKYPDKAKLLYIYLATHPDLSCVGVVSPNIEVAIIQSGLTKDEFRYYTKFLKAKKKISVREYEGKVYFIVPEHFNNIPKSQATVTRVQKELGKLPKELRMLLAFMGITISSKVRKFVKPTAQEVTRYALGQGHNIDGVEFVRSYEEYSHNHGKTDIWVDSRGTEVRDWKAKLRRIWFKDENKIKILQGTPKGYETFYVVGAAGRHIYPEKWVDGKPWSKSISSDILLKREFKKI